MVGKKSDNKALIWFSGVVFAVCSCSAVYADDSTDIHLHFPADQTENQGALLGESVPVDSSAGQSQSSTPSQNPNPSQSPTATPTPSANAPATAEPGGCPVLHKATSFTFGVIVNTPKAIVRNSKSEIVSDTKELIGDSKKPGLVAAAGALSVPFGITSGICEGVCSGLVNSWKHGTTPVKEQADPGP